MSDKQIISREIKQIISRDMIPEFSTAFEIIKRIPSVYYGSSLASGEYFGAKKDRHNNYTYPNRTILYYNNPKLETFDQKFGRFTGSFAEVGSEYVAYCAPKIHKSLRANAIVATSNERENFPLLERIALSVLQDLIITPQLFGGKVAKNYVKKTNMNIELKDLRQLEKLVLDASGTDFHIGFTKNESITEEQEATRFYSLPNSLFSHPSYTVTAEQLEKCTTEEERTQLLTYTPPATADKKTFLDEIPPKTVVDTTTREPQIFKQLNDQVKAIIPSVKHIFFGVNGIIIWMNHKNAITSLEDENFFTFDEAMFLYSFIFTTLQKVYPTLLGLYDFDGAVPANQNAYQITSSILKGAKKDTDFKYFHFCSPEMVEFFDIQPEVNFISEIGHLALKNITEAKESANPKARYLIPNADVLNSYLEIFKKLFDADTERALTLINYRLNVFTEAKKADPKLSYKDFLESKGYDYNSRHLDADPFINPFEALANHATDMEEYSKTEEFKPNILSLLEFDGAYIMPREYTNLETRANEVSNPATWFKDFLSSRYHTIMDKIQEARSRVDRIKEALADAMKTYLELTESMISPNAGKEDEEKSQKIKSIITKYRPIIGYEIRNDDTLILELFNKFTVSDPKAFAPCIHNIVNAFMRSDEYSYHQDGLICSSDDNDKNAAILEKILTTIFVTETKRFIPHVKSNVIVRLGQMSERFKNEIKIGSDFIPNPHIMGFNCFGTYNELITSAVEEENYEDVIELVLSACSEMAWGDAPVAKKLLKYINTRCCAAWIYDTEEKRFITTMDLIDYINERDKK